MSADILQFLPRANPKADRAFRKGAEPYGEKLLGLMSSADREAILRAGAVEIESVRVVGPVDNAPETCLIDRKEFFDAMLEPVPVRRYADTAPAELNPDKDSA